jgi:hypothetical protein
MVRPPPAITLNTSIVRKAPALGQELRRFQDRRPLLASPGSSAAVHRPIHEIELADCRIPHNTQVDPVQFACFKIKLTS